MMKDQQDNDDDMDPFGTTKWPDSSDIEVMAASVVAKCEKLIFAN